MTRLAQTDFRATFHLMAPQAIVTQSELAELLGTTSNAISQKNYRGELPPKAFPDKRKAVWFVRDIKEWLDALAASRAPIATKGKESSSQRARTGRPRIEA